VPDMVHVRDGCKNMSTTISLEENLFELVDNYRFSRRKENRSQAIADLLIKGLKYEELLQKKRKRVTS
jgi:metal-responsive CopG/Arc/MetJ family transcriptional regulator